MNFKNWEPNRRSALRQLGFTILSATGLLSIVSVTHADSGSSGDGSDWL